MLKSSRALGDVHDILRWVGVPLFLLIPFALVAVWNVASGVNLSGESICTVGPPALWEQIWAPVHLVTVALVVTAMARMWWKKGQCRRQRIRSVKRAGRHPIMH